MKFVQRTIARTLGVCAAMSTLACGSDDAASDTAANTGAASSGTAAGDDAGTGEATMNSNANPTADDTAGGDTVADSADPTATDTAGDTAADDTAGQATGELEDLDMTPEDFACLLDWPRVRRFRITNLLGYEAEAMAVAENPDGGVYPVGTVIQLIPNEAMVKRAEGWSEETSDWEFFSLATSAAGTEIEDRGTTETINAFGGNCFGCHTKAAPQWDLICEQDHGCDPIPIPEATINMLQENDPRCD